MLNTLKYKKQNFLKGKLHLKAGHLLLLVLLLSASSCKKWLAVSPATQIKEDKQFSTQQGFVDALFGVYQKAAGTNGYSYNATYGFVDVMAQLYENKSSQTTTWYGQTARYNFVSEVATQQNVRSTINNIWGNSYASIAQANYILKNVDSRPGVLSPAAYKIIKGEALALRGFLHFDLVRLFAPAYTDAASAAANAIPYMEAFTVTPQAKLTLGAALDKCEADLKAAEVLLADHQTIDQIALNQGSTSADLFLMFRQNHLNYWAVKGMLARLYMYKGDKTNALKYALEVINSAKFSFASPTTLSVDATTTASDMTFSSEHLFSFYVSGLKGISDNYFKNSTAAGGDANDLFSTKAKLTALYETSVVGYGTDIRNPDASKSLWTQVTTGVVYTKKYYSDNVANVKQFLVPVLRLPEMYYIAAEAAATYTDGLTYLNAVRTARLLPALTTASVTSDAVLNAEIQKEYRKEFYGEGQIWYYFKRKNVTTIPDGVGNPMTAAKYTLPLPLAELEFGK
ncbi:RagB/SusD family nutrient uptake outer membrane protein [Lacibacter luteus]|uniref:RagB/SusD family nutrient uptake outer membrane protein n=1 Tax=Lacibacter luteus TaxID=2508719 RepID=A0A4Q1CFL6_9BACT|nr:RagB/SusD family nutrient uptake outer membrane protein [Lacibacter luteus]RXK58437.1 RagB/SusD family nutrient uptake outer membrane protein [Lacibacter luteus]